ncbi:antitoxin family protein [Planctopirus hydrillae]|uniref:Uncharacterized protein n=1 Tax=Planctopirus hydrillae TaxID=1841610 RepID=A0A1C3ECQ4_9PLAN|nr:antitoxin family protein [Planctopirus hydrillae]ODA31032.1 hypothetical protein A6X21_22830 [Planctopirus hydrillae]
MQQAFEAIYENGTFRPLPGENLTISEGSRVRITVENEPEPKALELALNVFADFTESEIQEIEEIALNRDHFFGSRDAS